MKKSLESRVAAFGLQDKIGKVLIPTESVTESRRQEYTSRRMFYPGYVLVEMDMDDHVWHVVDPTPRVTGFVGTGQQPTPLSEEEVQHIVYKVADSREKPKLKVKFEKQESVRITDTFASFTGIVDEVNEDRRDVESDGNNFRALDPVNWNSTRSKTLVFVVPRSVSIPASQDEIVAMVDTELVSWIVGGQPWSV